MYIKTSMAQHMLRRLCLVVAILVTLMSPTDASWKWAGRVGRRKRAFKKMERAGAEAMAAGEDAPLAEQLLLFIADSFVELGSEFMIEQAGEAMAGRKTVFGQIRDKYKKMRRGRKKSNFKTSAINRPRKIPAPMVTQSKRALKRARKALQQSKSIATRASRFPRLARGAKKIGGAIYKRLPPRGAVMVAAGVNIGLTLIGAAIAGEFTTADMYEILLSLVPGYALMKNILDTAMMVYSYGKGIVDKCKGPATECITSFNPVYALVGGLMPAPTLGQYQAFFGGVSATQATINVAVIYGAAILIGAKLGGPIGALVAVVAVALFFAIMDWTDSGDYRKDQRIIQNHKYHDQALSQDYAKHGPARYLYNEVLYGAERLFLAPMEMNDEYYIDPYTGNNNLQERLNEFAVKYVWSETATDIDDGWRINPIGIFEGRHFYENDIENPITGILRVNTADKEYYTVRNPKHAKTYWFDDAESGYSYCVRCFMENTITFNYVANGDTYETLVNGTQLMSFTETYAAVNVEDNSKLQVRTLGTTVPGRIVNGLDTSRVSMFGHAPQRHPRYWHPLKKVSDAEATKRCNDMKAGYIDQLANCYGITTGVSSENIAEQLPELSASEAIAGNHDYKEYQPAGPCDENQLLGEARKRYCDNKFNELIEAAEKRDCSDPNQIPDHLKYQDYTDNILMEYFGCDRIGVRNKGDPKHLNRCWFCQNNGFTETTGDYSGDNYKNKKLTDVARWEGQGNERRDCPVFNPYDCYTVAGHQPWQKYDTGSLKTDERGKTASCPSIDKGARCFEYWADGANRDVYLKPGELMLPVFEPVSVNKYIRLDSTCAYGASGALPYSKNICKDNVVTKFLSKVDNQGFLLTSVRPFAHAVKIYPNRRLVKYIDSKGQPTGAPGPYEIILAEQMVYPNTCATKAHLRKPCKKGFFYVVDLNICVECEIGYTSNGGDDTLCFPYYQENNMQYTFNALKDFIDDTPYFYTVGRQTKMLTNTGVYNHDTTIKDYFKPVLEASLTFTETGNTCNVFVIDVDYDSTYEYAKICGNRLEILNTNTFTLQESMHSCKTWPVDNVLQGPNMICFKPQDDNPYKVYKVTANDVNLVYEFSEEEDTKPQDIDITLGKYKKYYLIKIFTDKVMYKELPFEYSLESQTTKVVDIQYATDTTTLIKNMAIGNVTHVSIFNWNDDSIYNDFTWGHVVGNGKLWYDIGFMYDDPLTTSTNFHDKSQFIKYDSDGCPSDIEYVSGHHYPCTPNTGAVEFFDEESAIYFSTPTPTKIHDDSSEFVAVETENHPVWHQRRTLKSWWWTFRSEYSKIDDIKSDGVNYVRWPALCVVEDSSSVKQQCDGDDFGFRKPLNAYGDTFPGFFAERKYYYEIGKPFTWKFGASEIPFVTFDNDRKTTQNSYTLSFDEGRGDDFDYRNSNNDAEYRQMERKQLQPKHEKDMLTPDFPNVDHTYIQSLLNENRHGRIWNARVGNWMSDIINIFQTMLPFSDKRVLTPNERIIFKKRYVEDASDYVGMPKFFPGEFHLAIYGTDCPNEHEQVTSMRSCREFADSEGYEFDIAYNQKDHALSTNAHHAPCRKFGGKIVYTIQSGNPKDTSSDLTRKVCQKVQVANDCGTGETPDAVATATHRALTMPEIITSINECPQNIDNAQECAFAALSKLERYIEVNEITDINMPIGCYVKNNKAYYNTIGIGTLDTTSPGSIYFCYDNQKTVSNAQKCSLTCPIGYEWVSESADGAPTLGSGCYKKINSEKNWRYHNKPLLTRRQCEARCMMDRRCNAYTSTASYRPASNEAIYQDANVTFMRQYRAKILDKEGIDSLDWSSTDDYFLYGTCILSKGGDTKTAVSSGDMRSFMRLSTTDWKAYAPVRGALGNTSPQRYQFTNRRGERKQCAVGCTSCSNPYTCDTFHSNWGPPVLNGAYQYPSDFVSFAEDRDKCVRRPPVGFSLNNAMGGFIACLPGSFNAPYESYTRTLVASKDFNGITYEPSPCDIFNPCHAEATCMNIRALNKTDSSMNVLFNTRARMVACVFRSSKTSEIDTLSAPTLATCASPFNVFSDSRLADVRPTYEVNHVHKNTIGNILCTEFNCFYACELVVSDDDRTFTGRVSFLASAHPTVLETQLIDSDNKLSFEYMAKKRICELCPVGWSSAGTIIETYGEEEGTVIEIVSAEQFKTTELKRADTYYIERSITINNQATTIVNVECTDTGSQVPNVCTVTIDTGSNGQIDVLTVTPASAGSASIDLVTGTSAYIVYDMNIEADMFVFGDGIPFGTRILEVSTIPCSDDSECEGTCDTTCTGGQKFWLTFAPTMTQTTTVTFKKGSALPQFTIEGDKRIRPSTQCYQCAAGKYSSDLGSAQCYQCPAGQYSSDNNDRCIACTERSADQVKCSSVHGYDDVIVSSHTSNTNTFTATTENADPNMVGRKIQVMSGAHEGESAKITAFNSGTDQYTVDKNFANISDARIRIIRRTVLNEFGVPMDREIVNGDTKIPGETPYEYDEDDYTSGYRHESTVSKQSKNASKYLYRPIGPETVDDCLQRAKKTKHPHVLISGWCEPTLATEPDSIQTPLEECSMVELLGYATKNVKEDPLSACISACTDTYEATGYVKIENGETTFYISGENTLFSLDATNKTIRMITGEAADTYGMAYAYDSTSKILTTNLDNSFILHGDLFHVMGADKECEAVIIRDAKCYSVPKDCTGAVPISSLQVDGHTASFYPLVWGKNKVAGAYDCNDKCRRSDNCKKFVLDENGICYSTNNAFGPGNRPYDPMDTLYYRYDKPDKGLPYYNSSYTRQTNPYILETATENACKDACKDKIWCTRYSFDPDIYTDITNTTTKYFWGEKLFENRLSSSSTLCHLFPHNGDFEEKWTYKDIGIRLTNMGNYEAINTGTSFSLDIQPLTTWVRYNVEGTVGKPIVSMEDEKATCIRRPIYRGRTETNVHVGALSTIYQGWLSLTWSHIKNVMGIDDTKLAQLQGIFNNPYDLPEDLDEIRTKIGAATFTRLEAKKLRKWARVKHILSGVEWHHMNISNTSRTTSSLSLESSPFGNWVTSVIGTVDWWTDIKVSSQTYSRETYLSRYDIKNIEHKGPIYEFESVGAALKNLLQTRTVRSFDGTTKIYNSEKLIRTGDECEQAARQYIREDFSDKWDGFSFTHKTCFVTAGDCHGGLETGDIKFKYIDEGRQYIQNLQADTGTELMKGGTAMECILACMRTRNCRNVYMADDGSVDSSCRMNNDQLGFDVRTFLRRLVSPPDETGVVFTTLSACRKRAKTLGKTYYIPFEGKCYVSDTYHPEALKATPDADGKFKRALRACAAQDSCKYFAEVDGYELADTCTYDVSAEECSRLLPTDYTKCQQSDADITRSRGDYCDTQKLHYGGKWTPLYGFGDGPYALADITDPNDASITHKKGCRLADPAMSGTRKKFVISEGESSVVDATVENCGSTSLPLYIKQNFVYTGIGGAEVTCTATTDCPFGVCGNKDNTMVCKDLDGNIQDGDKTCSGTTDCGEGYTCQIKDDTQVCVVENWKDVSRLECQWIANTHSLAMETTTLGTTTLNTMTCNNNEGSAITMFVTSTSTAQTEPIAVDSQDDCDGYHGEGTNLTTIDNKNYCECTTTCGNGFTCQAFSDSDSTQVCWGTPVSTEEADVGRETINPECHDDVKKFFNAFDTSTNDLLKYLKGYVPAYEQRMTWNAARETDEVTWKKGNWYSGGQDTANGVDNLCPLFADRSSSTGAYVTSRGQSFYSLGSYFQHLIDNGVYTASDISSTFNYTITDTSADGYVYECGQKFAVYNGPECTTDGGCHETKHMCLLGHDNNQGAGSDGTITTSLYHEPDTTGKLCILTEKLQINGFYRAMFWHGSDNAPENITSGDNTYFLKQNHAAACLPQSKFCGCFHASFPTCNKEQIPGASRRRLEEPIYDTCQNDNECEGDTICEGGQCVEPAPEQQSCQTADDCSGQDEICDDGHCTITCTLDTDCEVYGQPCTDNICKAPAEPGSNPTSPETPAPSATPGTCQKQSCPEAGDAFSWGAGDPAWNGAVDKATTTCDWFRDFVEAIGTSTAVSAGAHAAVGKITIPANGFVVAEGPEKCFFSPANDKLIWSRSGFGEQCLYPVSKAANIPDLTSIGTYQCKQITKTDTTTYIPDATVNNIRGVVLSKESQAQPIYTGFDYRTYKKQLRYPENTVRSYAPAFANPERLDGTAAAYFDDVKAEATATCESACYRYVKNSYYVDSHYDSISDSDNLYRCEGMKDKIGQAAADNFCTSRFSLGRANYVGPTSKCVNNKCTDPYFTGYSTTPSRDTTQNIMLVGDNDEICDRATISTDINKYYTEPYALEKRSPCTSDLQCQNIRSSLSTCESGLCTRPLHILACKMVLKLDTFVSHNDISVRLQEKISINDPLLNENKEANRYTITFGDEKVYVIEAYVGNNALQNSPNGPLTSEPYYEFNTTTKETTIWVDYSSNLEMFNGDYDPKKLVFDTNEIPQADAQNAFNHRKEIKLNAEGSRLLYFSYREERDLSKYDHTFLDIAEEDDGTEHTCTPPRSACPTGFSCSSTINGISGVCRRYVSVVKQITNTTNIYNSDNFMFTPLASRIDSTEVQPATGKKLCRTENTHYSIFNGNLYRPPVGNRDLTINGENVYDTSYSSLSATTQSAILGNVYERIPVYGGYLDTDDKMRSCAYQPNFEYNKYANTCKACSAGKFSYPGGTQCISCATGKVRALNGPNGCESCEAGKIAAADNSECIDCAAGKFWNFETDTCQTCPAGKVSTKGMDFCWHFCLDGSTAIGQACGPTSRRRLETTSTDACQPGDNSNNNDLCDSSETKGCIDPDACNYNKDATFSTDCVFAKQYKNCDGSCINDVNVNGICDEEEDGMCDQAGACNPYDATNGTHVLNNDHCRFPPRGRDCEDECTSGDKNEAGYCPSEQGCTDKDACNYDENALYDDGSCYKVTDKRTESGLPAIRTCPSTACTSEPCGTCKNDADGDGLCDEEEGCRNENACNYNPLAADDPLNNAECVTAGTYEKCVGTGKTCINDVDDNEVCDELEGCMDSTACNHKSTATQTSTYFTCKHKETGLTCQDTCETDTNNDGICGDTTFDTAYTAFEDCAENDNCATAAALTVSCDAKQDFYKLLCCGEKEGTCGNQMPTCADTSCTVKNYNFAGVGDWDTRLPVDCVHTLSNSTDCPADGKTGCPLAREIKQYTVTVNATNGGECVPKADVNRQCECNEFYKDCSAMTTWLAANCNNICSVMCNDIRTKLMTLC